MTNQQRRALERALVDALMRSLQPALHGVVAAFNRELDAVLAQIDPAALPPRRGQMGQSKRCTVCRLKGARNDAALPPSHSQADHRRWKNGWPIASAAGGEDAA